MLDVVIIGAGVVGAAAARELSRYKLQVLVIEKEEDVCCGSSKANSGLVHAGFDAKPGSLKAEMNVRGNRMMEELCRELDVPFRRTGALVLAFSEEEADSLQRLLQQGRENGVEQLSILEKKQLKELEPHLSDNVKAGLLAESAGIVCPFTLTIALAENACVNGVSFVFNTEVVTINRCDGSDGSYYEVKTNHGEPIKSRMIINCAGVHSDDIHNMISKHPYHITPRRGEYCLLDKSAGTHVGRTIFKVPGLLGKGILVTPTVHGNLLLGPTAENLRDKKATDTSAPGLQRIIEGTQQTVKDIPFRQVITSFAGLRAHEDGDDFIIQEAEDAEGFVDAVGIASPGLSSAPAIGEQLADIVTGRLSPVKKDDFIAFRKDIIHLDHLSFEEQQRLIKVKPEYGNIICRCEMVTEGEILDAIYRPLGAKSLDGIKRRTRAGMGRCQSGFCSPRVLELLADANHIPLTEVTKSGLGSELLVGRNKEVTP